MCLKVFFLSFFLLAHNYHALIPWICFMKWTIANLFRIELYWTEKKKTKVIHHLILFSLNVCSVLVSTILPFKKAIADEWLSFRNFKNTSFQFFNQIKFNLCKHNINVCVMTHGGAHDLLNWKDEITTCKSDLTILCKDAILAASVQCTISRCFYFIAVIFTRVKIKYDRW